MQKPSSSLSRARIRSVEVMVLLRLPLRLAHNNQHPPTPAPIFSCGCATKTWNSCARSVRRSQHPTSPPPHQHAHHPTKPPSTASPLHQSTDPSSHLITGLFERLKRGHWLSRCSHRRWVCFEAETTAAFGNEKVPSRGRGGTAVSVSTNRGRKAASVPALVGT